MKSYKLKVTNKSGVGAVYAKYCLPRMIGEILITNGCGKVAFSKFTAAVATLAINAGDDEDKLAQRFRSLNVGNASQVRQAIQDLRMTFSDGETMLVKNYWKENGVKSSDDDVVDLLMRDGVEAPEVDEDEDEES
jgi:hypothetical protein